MSEETRLVKFSWPMSHLGRPPAPGCPSADPSPPSLCAHPRTKPIPLRRGFPSPWRPRAAVPVSAVYRVLSGTWGSLSGRPRGHRAQELFLPFAPFGVSQTRAKVSGKDGLRPGRRGYPKARAARLLFQAARRPGTRPRPRLLPKPGGRSALDRKCPARWRRLLPKPGGRSGLDRKSRRGGEGGRASRAPPSPPRARALAGLGWDGNRHSEARARTGPGRGVGGPRGRGRERRRRPPLAAGLFIPRKKFRTGR